MKLAMSITMDGLVRALRWKSHDLAEALERGYAERDMDVAFDESVQRREMSRLTKEDHDDAGR